MNRFDERRESAYAELDRDREIVTAGFFGNGIATFDTWEIDESWFDDAAFALCGLQETFGEAMGLVRDQVRQGRRLLTGSLRRPLTKWQTQLHLWL